MNAMTFKQTIGCITSIGTARHKYQLRASLTLSVHTLRCGASSRPTYQIRSRTSQSKPVRFTMRRTICTTIRFDRLIGKTTSSSFSGSSSSKTLWSADIKARCSTKPVSLKTYLSTEEIVGFSSTVK